MTSAALSFEPAAAPVQGSTPSLPLPGSPIGDFAGMVEGRLQSRSQREGEPAVVPEPSPADPALDPDVALSHRPLFVRASTQSVAAPLSVVSTEFTVRPETVGGSTGVAVSETEESASAAGAVKPLPTPSEDLPVEIIAGCLVWSVPLQPLPQPTAVPTSGSESNGTGGTTSSSPLVGVFATPLLPAAVSKSVSTSGDGTPSGLHSRFPKIGEPGMTPPTTTIPTTASAGAVVLDPTQWTVATTGQPALETQAGPRSGAMLDAEPPARPMASAELVDSVAAAVDEQTGAGLDGGSAESGGEEDARRTPQPQTDKTESSGAAAPRAASRGSDRSGYSLVSPAGISTARELGRMNTAPQRVETAESMGKIAPVQSSMPPHRTAASVPADFGVTWLPNGLPAAFVAHSLAADAAPIQAADPLRQMERIEAAERVRAVVSHEVEVLKAAGAGSLAVMLRPDPETELFVQITRNGDRIDAFVRVEKGDSAELRQSWERLQSSLAAQQVRLLPLQSSELNGQSQRQQNSQHDGHTFNESRGEFREGAGSGREQGGGRDQRPERHSFRLANDTHPVRATKPVRTTVGHGRSLETWA